MKELLTILIIAIITIIIIAIITWFTKTWITITIIEEWIIISSWEEITTTDISITTLITKGTTLISMETTIWEATTTIITRIIWTITIITVITISTISTITISIRFRRKTRKIITKIPPKKYLLALALPNNGFNLIFKIAIVNWIPATITIMVITETIRQGTDENNHEVNHARTVNRNPGLKDISIKRSTNIKSIDRYHTEQNKSSINCLILKYKYKIPNMF
jgi:hypothetical protein